MYAKGWPFRRIKFWVLTSRRVHKSIGDCGTAVLSQLGAYDFTCDVHHADSSYLLAALALSLFSGDQSGYRIMRAQPLCFGDQPYKKMFHTLRRTFRKIKLKPYVQSDTSHNTCTYIFFQSYNNNLTKTPKCMSFKQYTFFLIFFFYYIQQ